MTNPAEGFVQVAQDGTGKKIRNAEVTFADAAGNLHTVEMQVVTLADPDGRLITSSRLVDLLGAILLELKSIRSALELEGIQIK